MNSFLRFAISEVRVTLRMLVLMDPGRYQANLPGYLTRYKSGLSLFRYKISSRILTIIKLLRL